MGGLTTTIVAIERSADMDALRQSVRAFAAPLGYDRFILYAAPLFGDHRRNKFSKTCNLIIIEADTVIQGYSNTIYKEIIGQYHNKSPVDGGIY